MSQDQANRKFDEDEQSFKHGKLSIQRNPAARGSRRADNEPPIKQGIKRLELDSLLPLADRSSWTEKGGARYVVVGAPGKGKSWIIRSLMFSKSHFIPVCSVVSENEDVNHNFKQHVPDLFIFTENTPEVAEKVIRRQRIACSQLANANPLMTFVADDCMNDKKVFKHKHHVGLFKISRQLKVMYILSCQYMLDLSTELRNALTGAFICREDKLEVVEKLYKVYGGQIPSLQIFKDLLSDITTDNCCIYIDFSTTTDNWLDNVYWFRAFDTRPEVGGPWDAVCQDAKAFAEERYDKGYDPLAKIAGAAVA